MADDLLQGLKDALAVNNGQDSESGSQDTMEKLLKALENMPGVTEEEKLNMIKNIAGGLLGDRGSQLPVGGVISNPWLEFGVLFGLITLIVLALALIGYKLYNNTLQREKRRELKKLQKEQKKKK